MGIPVLKLACAVMQQLPVQPLPHPDQELQLLEVVFG